MHVLSEFVKVRLFAAALWSRDEKKARGVGRRTSVRPGTRSSGVIHVLVGTIVCLLSIEAAANPSFGGKEFRKVWGGGTFPDGPSGVTYINDIYLTSAGLYVDTDTISPFGIYFLDDGGAVTVAEIDQPPFSEASGFIVMGSNPDGSLLFCPANVTNLYPCQLFNGNGVTAVASPTPTQTLSFGNYFDGRMTYMTYSYSTRTRIWYYEEGNPAQLWLEDATTPGLTGPLDYDGETLAYSVSLAGGGYELWRRASDGTLTKIIGYGDLMPGEATSVFVGNPAVDTVEVDQGKVYMIAPGWEPTKQIQMLISSSDGVNFDIIANRWEDVPGLPGVTINSMQLLQVSNGKVWLFVTQSDGDKVLYQIVNGVWTRVVGVKDSFDGIIPWGIEVFEHASLGDSVVVQLTMQDSSSPLGYSTQLYTNADLPGFPAGNTGAIMEIVRELGGGWTIAAMVEAGTTNTLQTITSLTNTVWETVGAPQIADGTNVLEWTVSPTNSAGFFRLIQ